MMLCLGWLDFGIQTRSVYLVRVMMDSEIKKPILSPVLSQFLRRRFQELVGVVLVVLGLALLLALVTGAILTNLSFNS